MFKASANVMLPTSIIGSLPRPHWYTATLGSRSFMEAMVNSLKLHYKLEPLHGPMFIETNPIPVKTALALMGKIAEEFRLPLCPMADANKEKLKKALKDYGLI